MGERVNGVRHEDVKMNQIISHGAASILATTSEFHEPTSNSTNLHITPYWMIYRKLLRS